MKRCKGCDGQKPLEAFPREARNRDGRAGKCKACLAAHGVTYYQSNRKRIRERDRQYYIANAERIKARAREDYESNRAARQETRRLYHARNWSAIYEARGNYYREKNRSYYRNHPEKWLNYNGRRRAALAEASPEVEAWIGYLLGQPCAYCGDTEQIEIDHVVPLARGGTHEIANLVAACFTCNRGKGSKLLDEWRAA
jgi:5-methylcytosine-specific restriction endonuclease McrA